MCPGRPATRLKDIVGRRQQSVARPAQPDWIEVSLDRMRCADRLPRVVDVLTPVDADHIAARLDQIRQDRRGADAEMNQRHSDVT